MKRWPIARLRLALRLLREPDRSEHEQVWADALAKIESIQAQLRAGRWARDDRTSRPP